MKALNALGVTLAAGVFLLLCGLCRAVGRIMVFSTPDIVIKPLTVWLRIVLSFQSANFFHCIVVCAIILNGAFIWWICVCRKNLQLLSTIVAIGSQIISALALAVTICISLVNYLNYYRVELLFNKYGIYNIHSSNANYTLTSNLEKDGEYYFLAFTLKVPTTVTVYKSDLPWGIRDSLTLTGVAEGYTETLSTYLYIDDPTGETITLYSDQVYTGRVNLNERLAKLSEALNKNNIIIFWSYKLEPISAEGSTQSRKDLGRSGGWHVIDSTKAGSKTP